MMNTKRATAILAFLALSASVSAQVSPQGNLSQNSVKFEGIDGEVISGPALLVIGFSQLPVAIDLPGGNRLSVSPDVVTIFDAGATYLPRLAKALDSGFVYAQAMALEDGGGSTASSGLVAGGWALSPTLSRPRLGYTYAIGNE
ncbi:MAG: hypothetical protein VYE77_02275 [Planctomycetota bacterium]|nr:hypothetical protein [Planctomycetota bacterium]